MRLCVSITGKDGPGIIAAVTNVFYRFHGNLEDASMSVLGGEFAMILIVSFPPSAKFKSLLEKMKVLEKKRKLTITARSIKPRFKRSAFPKQPRTIPYLISIFGRDRAGIVYRVSDLLAQNRLNITDLDSKLILSKPKNIYGLLIEVDIPKQFPIGRLQRRLAKIAGSMHVDLTFKAVEPLTL